MVDNKSVYSIEEILDSVNNVCTNLKESGQLIKRNKTKDHLQHQLMEVKIDEMFFFGLTVGFKPLRDEGDPAVQKDLQVAHNRRGDG